MTPRTALALAAALAAAGLTLSTAAASEHGRRHEREEGDDHEAGEHGREPYGARRAAGRGPAIDAAYAKECGACHLAFPPRQLPASAWRGVMTGLDRHFGQDASLDEPTRARLEAWLVERAGRERPGASSLRITEQPRWRREHRELPQGVAARPGVRSLANCAACHSGAARWDFEEDGVKIPRG